MTARSFFLLISLTLLTFVTAGAGGLHMLGASAQIRELSAQEKQGLRGGQIQLNGWCCSQIPQCQDLPNYWTCGHWTTGNGGIACRRGDKAEFNYNGNMNGCLTSDTGQLCDQGASAACIIGSDCEWSEMNNDCELGSGGWYNYAAGYDSCTPAC